MSRYVSRDPFARTELHKARVYTSLTCAWCGSHKVTPTGKKYLFRYYVEHDAGRKEKQDHLFCSVGCMRDYNL